MTSLEILLAAIGLFTLLGFLSFALVSLREMHHRASRLSFLLFLISGIIFASLLISPKLIQNIGLGIILAVSLAGVVLFLWPSAKEITPSPPPEQRVDERTIMFARARLQPGTPNFEAYYADHPEHKSLDDAFRQNPGLLEPGALFFNQKLAASPQGDFFLTESLRDAVDGPVSKTKVVDPPDNMTDFIKNLAIYHGVRDVGVCRVQPYHIYSHIGRGSGEYGAEITLDQQFAVAVTVEMCHEMVNTGPRMPAVMESARQYAEAGKIAVALAAAIRAMGYPARAHIDGNYRVIAPLVAKDAGLGEIGRMGLLMTPSLGPRVRLAVVTTDLPLAEDQAAWYPDMIDFCSICKKCAQVCPSLAIPFGDRQEYADGTLRWKINPERCYTYWTRVGTDCGRCMAVCPYAHADNVMHNLIRLGVAQSHNFRRAALWMDDLFYGKKPLPHTPPDWIQSV
ncbi:MAG: reductive dehalogenase domain-containing protein [Brevefilum sp.]|nr:reductive dehalogenase domain-containing protein [Brevefilum sp.]MDT8381140.1 reductive dehalogenase domain-containing protein [Brevefilum sp.]MDW7755746.1 reductive dehalogenase domain-containing protein [Brevefilum sp.]